MLPELGGPLASGGAVNTSRLQRLMSRLVRDEEPSYKRRAVSGCSSRKMFIFSLQPLLQHHTHTHHQRIQHDMQHHIT
jgi:hypothetical protein